MGFNFDSILRQHEELMEESATDAPESAAAEEAADEGATASATATPPELTQEDLSGDGSADADVEVAVTAEAEPAEAELETAAEPVAETATQPVAETVETVEAEVEHTAEVVDASEGVPGGPDSEEVQFTVNGKDLATALKEVINTFGTNEDQLIYMAAVADGDFASTTAIAPDLATGRLVIGKMGQDRDHIFVDVPLKQVTTQGHFLVKEPQALANWANRKKVDVEVRHYEANQYQHFLELVEPGKSKHPFDNRTAYTLEEIDTWFAAVNDRFVQPSEPFNSATLAELLARAERVRGSIKTDSISDRAGDLFWTNKEVEFAAQLGHGQHTLAMSLKTAFTSKEDFEWEVTAETLKLLSKALMTGDATFRLEASSVNEAGDVVPATLQVSYSLPLSAESAMYTQLQLTVRRENPSIKNWETGNTHLVDEKACKLWATVSTQGLFREAESIWDLYKSAVLNIQTTTRQVDGTPKTEVALVTGTPDDPGHSYVDATHGDSQISELYLHPDIKGMIKAITDGYDFFQILSYPHQGSESESAMIIAPLPEGADTSKKVCSPEQYLIVTWDA